MEYVGAGLGSTVFPAETSEGDNMAGEAGETAGDLPPHLAKLTEKQRDFVAGYIKTHGNVTEAARLAGYSDPDAYGYQVARSERVRRAIEAETRQYLRNHGNEAVSVLLFIMRDERAAPSTRLKAAEAVLDRAGMGKSVEVNGSVEHRHAHKVEDIGSFLADLHKARSSRKPAPPVLDITPSPETGETGHFPALSDDRDAQDVVFVGLPPIGEDGRDPEPVPVDVTPAPEPVVRAPMAEPAARAARQARGRPPKTKRR